MDPKVANQVRNTLKHWQTDPDLTSVREEKALAGLPEAERKLWQEFWGGVSKMIQTEK